MNRIRVSLVRFFVNKRELIDLMVVAAVAQAPLLLVDRNLRATSSPGIRARNLLPVVRAAGHV